jgi:hypothetical protein
LTCPNTRCVCERNNNSKGPVKLYLKNRKPVDYSSADVRFGPAPLPYPSARSRSISRCRDSSSECSLRVSCINVVTPNSVTAVCEVVEKDAFDLEARRLRVVGELGASARNSASSLSDKPDGTNPSGGKSGDTVGREEDRLWSAIISASGSSITKGCCSAEKSWFASGEFGSKGVTIICGPASMKSIEKDRIDLGLDRSSFRLRFLLRCTKVTIPITAKMAAATPPMVPPIIAPLLFRFFGDGEVVFVGVGSAVIVRLETLREGPNQK